MRSRFALGRGAAATMVAMRAHGSDERRSRVNLSGVIPIHFARGRDAQKQRTRFGPICHVVRQRNGFMVGDSGFKGKAATQSWHTRSGVQSHPMARNSQTFEIGNHAARAGLKLTPEIHELFVNTVRQTGRLSIAAGRCCVSPTTVRSWLRQGRAEKPRRSSKTSRTTSKKAAQSISQSPRAAWASSRPAAHSCCRNSTG
jgi:hypothetical protein